MSKYVGIREVNKKNLPDGFRAFQFDFQLNGKRYYETVITKDMLEADAMRNKWTEGIRNNSKEIPLADLTFGAAWDILEEAFGKGKSRDGLKAQLESCCQDKSKLSEVRKIRKLLKKLSGYRKTFQRLFLTERVGRVNSFKEIDSKFYASYELYYCGVLNKESGWRAEQIKARAIFNKMDKLRIIPEEKCKIMRETWRKPGVEQKDYPNISKEDMGRLFNYIKEDNLHYYRAYAFMLRTGRRVEETTLYEKQDIIFNRNNRFERFYTRATTAKMKRKAFLETIDSKFEEMLWSAYQDSLKHKTPYLFLNKKGNKLDERRLCEYLKEKSKEILGVVITNHYFRHYFLTECGLRRIPWAEVSKISGLKDMKIYMQYYNHSTVEGQREVFALTKGIV